jgi:anti-sigma regulatory factor (Ser/Thr protein kinase)
MSGAKFDAPTIRLELISRPEAARLVRATATAAGEALGFDPELLSDVNTAVSEACNNVIVHAYADGPGPFSVELGVTPDGVEASILDHGCGIRHATPEYDGIKVGLSLMSAIADRAEFISRPEGGTEVKLFFRGSARAAPSGPSPGARASSWSGHAHLHAAVSGDVVLTVSPVELLAPVLGRVGRALAPSAGFSLERCAEVYLVTDALGAHAQQAAGADAVSVALGAHDQLLEFALAPLRAGTSSHLDGDESGPAPGGLAWLADELTVSQTDGHETLRVAIRDHRRS